MRLFILFIFIFSVSCKKETKSPNIDKPLTIAVSNYPLYWICNSLAPEGVTVKYPIPEDIDPAFWQPEPSDIQQLTEADIIFLNGATYEKWLETVTLPTSKVIDTTAGLEASLITISDASTHIHNGQSHSHDGTAFTTWLSPTLMTAQIAKVSKRLKDAYPNQAEAISLRQKELNAKLSFVYKEIDSSFKNQKAFLASHPVYQYLGEAYQLNIKSFLWEPDVMPDEQEWQKLEGLKKHSSYMLWEDEPRTEIKQRLASMGIKIIIFRPCGNTPPSKDYISEMNKNIENLKTITNE